MSGNNANTRSHVTNNHPNNRYYATINPGPTVAAIPPVFEAQNRRRTDENNNRESQQLPLNHRSSSLVPPAPIPQPNPANAIAWSLSGGGSQRRRMVGRTSIGGRFINVNNGDDEDEDEEEDYDEIDFMGRARRTGVTTFGNPTTNQTPTIMVPPPFGTNSELLLTSGDGGDGPEPSALAVWRERERRQRTIRVFMMFLLMLLLMEEEPNSSSVRHPNHAYRNGGIRGTNSNKSGRGNRYDSSFLDGVAKPLSSEVYRSRILQDERLRRLGQHHPRYHSLLNKQRHRETQPFKHDAGTTMIRSDTHHGDIVDYNEQVVQWALSLSDMEKDEFDSNVKIGVGDKEHGVGRRGVAKNVDNSAIGKTGTTPLQSRSMLSMGSNGMEKDPEDDRKVLHYPWNSTGFYRGDWKRLEKQDFKSANFAQASSGKRVSVNGKNDDYVENVDDKEDASMSDNRYDDSKHDVGIPSTQKLLKRKVKEGGARRRKLQGDSSGNTVEDFDANLLQQSKDLNLSNEASSLSTIASSYTTTTKSSYTKSKQFRPTTISTSATSPSTDNDITVMNALDMEETMLKLLHTEKFELFGVHVLPAGFALETRDDNNITTSRYEEIRFDQNNRQHEPEKQLHSWIATENKNVIESKLITGSKNGMVQKADDVSASENLPPVTLTRDSGRAAFQLFSRSIPAMKELSLVEGFIKLYDSTSPGYSTSKDLLLRVRGVLIHSIGRLSLTANADTSRAAFVMTDITDEDAIQTVSVKHSIVHQNDSSDDAASEEARKQRKVHQDKNKVLQRQRGRRLQEALKDLDNIDVVQVRRDALRYFDAESPVTGSDSQDMYQWTLATPNFDINKEYHGYKDASIPENSFDATVASKEYQISRLQNENENQLLLTETSSQSSIDRVQSSHELSDSLLEGRGRRNARRLYVHDMKKASTTPSAEASYHETQTNSSNNFSNGTITTKYLPPWSDIVIPFPYVRDNDEETLRRTRTPAARLMPPRERVLEANAAHCAFEINMDVTPVLWTVGAWRKLVSHHLEESKLLNPDRVDSDDDEITNEVDLNRMAVNAGKRGRTETTYLMASRSSRNLIEDEALVMNMIGEIRSPNCKFAALLNVTALRTDWEATTSKAISYSFYMMLVCLIQILILLRQLLHSQSFATATRVSILCIGWQTIIDALLCLAHIYLSLAVQPLFTAFASVAFFKLLIFCVIEMKYMAIIMQARNSSNGGQPTEVLRQQVAMLHLRFYIALIIVFVMMFSISDKYRLPFILILYSFWVPQIILNIITEAKSPMHRYYIYGMSATRMVVPLYMLALPGNFLKQVYPDTPTDVFTCEMLIIWISFQSAILIGQSKYGARFMIPARFLPPKFDYSRPIPASMLPPGAAAAILSYEQSRSVAVSDSKASASPATSNSPFVDASESTASSRRHNTTAVTTRNRMHSRSRNSRNSGMISEDHTLSSTAGSLSTTAVEERASPGDPSHTRLSPQATLTPSLSTPSCCVMECSICYDDIDIRKCKDYMLAPCNHLFHRPCLSQWMDVKMECPICRTELPAL